MANVHRLGLTNVVVSGNPNGGVGGLKYLKDERFWRGVVAKKIQILCI